MSRAAHDSGRRARTDPADRRDRPGRLGERLLELLLGIGVGHDRAAGAHPDRVAGGLERADHDAEIESGDSGWRSRSRPCTPRAAWPRVPRSPSSPGPSAPPSPSPAGTWHAAARRRRRRRAAGRSRSRPDATRRRGPRPGARAPARSRTRTPGRGRCASGRRSSRARPRPSSTPSAHRAPPPARLVRSGPRACPLDRLGPHLPSRCAGGTARATGSRRRRPTRRTAAAPGKARTNRSSRSPSNSATSRTHRLAWYSSPLGDPAPAIRDRHHVPGRPVGRERKRPRQTAAHRGRRCGSQPLAPHPQPLIEKVGALSGPQPLEPPPLTVADNDVVVERERERRARDRCRRARGKLLDERAEPVPEPSDPAAADERFPSDNLRLHPNNRERIRVRVGRARRVRPEHRQAAQPFAGQRERTLIPAQPGDRFVRLEARLQLHPKRSHGSITLPQTDAPARGSPLSR